MKRDTPFLFAMLPISVTTPWPYPEGQFFLPRKIERIPGLDVHKRSVVACLLFLKNGQPCKERQTFSTMTPDLERLRDWLKDHNCTCVAMESTGVFWKPIYNLLEEHFQVLIVNAQHIKTVPGRKTDVKDAEWARP
jgi:transposase